MSSYAKMMSTSCCADSSSQKPCMAVVIPRWCSVAECSLCERLCHSPGDVLDLPAHIVGLAEDFGVGRFCSLPSLVECDQRHREPLGDIVVQFARDPGPLSLLRLDQSAAQAGERFLGQLALRDIDNHADHPLQLAVPVEERAPVLLQPDDGTIGQMTPGSWTRFVVG